MKIFLDSCGMQDTKFSLCVKIGVLIIIPRTVIVLKARENKCPHVSRAEIMLDL